MTLAPILFSLSGFVCVAQDTPPPPAPPPPPGLPIDGAVIALLLIGLLYGIKKTWDITRAQSRS